MNGYDYELNNYSYRREHPLFSAGCWNTINEFNYYARRSNNNHLTKDISMEKVFIFLNKLYLFC
jgi:hypothetical protein